VKPLLPLDRATVFFDGTFAEPHRLAHPECVAVAADGAVWCGTENGDLMRISPDGGAMERIATTGGFIAGIAFDCAGRLFACDIRYGAVFVLDVASRKILQFGDAHLNIPNYPVVDQGRSALYVSDSHSFEQSGPGVWRFDLQTGEAGLWYSEPLAFANGMALHPDGQSLYVVESKAKRVIRIGIDRDGSQSGTQLVVDGLHEFPDGLAFAEDETLLIGCYEPSRIYRFDKSGGLETLIEDPEATTLCHVTNVAFRGVELFTANLGRWHITKIACGINGIALPLIHGR
jgi:sugar lactone lactonase YvrE